MMNEFTIQYLKNALKKLGIKEIPPNKAFSDHEFQDAMKAFGWKSGQAWCAYVAGLNVIQTLTELGLTGALTGFKKLFSANSQRFFKNCAKSPYMPTGTTPKVGSIPIWRYKGITGHTGIAITEVGAKHFKCIEGNSKDSVREVKREIDDRDIMGYIYIGEAQWNLL